MNLGDSGGLYLQDLTSFHRQSGAITKKYALKLSQESNSQQLALSPYSLSYVCVFFVLYYYMGIPEQVNNATIGVEKLARQR